MEIEKRVLLSTLWIFVTVNYMFCDIFTLFHAPDLNQFLTGHAGGMQITQTFLLTFAIIMEFALVMIVLSRILKYYLNRRLNIIAGISFTFIQSATLISGEFTMH